MPYLNVDNGHKLHYEVHGNKNGIPVLYVHGGPGGGCSPDAVRYFDKRKHKLILLDQRGAGKSKPFASLKANTTKHLVKDINELLDYLKIEQVHLFGGSWGSTLSLCYAIANPDRVKTMVLRGIFLGTKQEDKFYMGGGIKAFFPEEWKALIDLVPPKYKTYPLPYYAKMIQHKDKKVRVKFAKAFSTYELSILTLDHDKKKIEKMLTNDILTVGMGTMEVHYLNNGCFLPPNHILKNIGRIKHIPTAIVQGRYDMICPPLSAYKLHNAMENSSLHVVTAGHSSSDNAIQKELKRQVKKLISS